MKKSLKFVALMIASVMLLSSCGGNAKTPEEPTKTGEQTVEQTAKENDSEKSITFVLHNEPDGIDPNVTSNSFASPFLTNCFEGLVTYNENSELVPRLTES